jgi:hypothetical protein
MIFADLDLESQRICQTIGKITFWVIFALFVVWLLKNRYRTLCALVAIVVIVIWKKTFGH